MLTANCGNSAGFITKQGPARQNLGIGIPRHGPHKLRMSAQNRFGLVGLRVVQADLRADGAGQPFSIRASGDRANELAVLGQDTDQLEVRGGIDPQLTAATNLLSGLQQATPWPRA